MRFKLEPGETKYVLTRYRIAKSKQKGIERTYLWFDLFQYQRPGQSEKRHLIRIRNNVAWRNAKGIVVWRTAGMKARGTYKAYYPTEFNDVLHEEIRQYIDQKWGKVLQTTFVKPPERRKGFSNADEALRFLEEEESTSVE